MLALLLCCLAVFGGAIAKPTTSISNRIQKAEVADLAFLVDITGSMQPYIDGTKDAIRDIVDSLDTSEVKTLRMAFVGYRDFDDDPHFEILQFTESVNEFKNFLGQIRSTGGGDTPEDVFGGLEQIGKLKWDKEAGTRVLIHIADAPAHGTQYSNLRGKHTQGDPEGRSLTSLMLTLKLQNIDYNFGRIKGSSTNKMIEEFSKVYGETIPQFDIKVGRSIRPCSGIECCVRPPRPCRGKFCPFTPVISPRAPPSLSRSVASLSSAGSRAKRAAASVARTSPVICPTGTVYRPRSVAGPSGPSTSEYIASGAVRSIKRGYEKARSRLGEA